MDRRKAREGETAGEEARIVRDLNVLIYEWNGRQNAARERDSVSCYCAMKIDAEEVARTSPVLRQMRPYWNEPFRFNVTQPFKSLFFYVTEQGRAKDSVVGKVAIEADSLKRGQSIEQWFPLEEINADSEVTGQIQLRISIVDLEQKNSYSAHIEVLDGSNLALEEMYVKVLVKQAGAEDRTFRSQLAKRSSEPEWNEAFACPLPTLKSVTENEEMVWAESAGEFSVSVWSSANTFMGEFVAHFRPDHLKCATEWFQLSPRALSQANEELGSLRLKIEYCEDSVLPLRCYKPLVDLLFSSLMYTDQQMSPISMMASMCKDKEKVAKLLVTVLLEYNMAVAIMQSMVSEEISACSDSATLFRGNTLTTKLLDRLMKIVGQEYLRMTLLPGLDEIFTAKLTCEIDPERVREGESIDVNRANLQYCVGRLLVDILQSAKDCPKDLRTVFRTIREQAIAKFPDNANVRYTAVSSFVILRYFVAAIVNPLSFRLIRFHESDEIHRTLTLISKTLQNIGNLGQQRGKKEEFMAKINEEMVQGNIASVKSYLDAVSSADERAAPDAQRVKSTLTSAELYDSLFVIKEGYMVKRSQGRNPVLGMSFRNFKKRYFILTQDGLKYYKEKGEAAIFRIPSDKILAVERVDESAFNMPYVFQVIQPERNLYLVAANSTEQMEWIKAIASVSRENRNLARVFHPGVFLKEWTCCKVPTEDAAGCERCAMGLSEKYPRLDDETYPVDHCLELIHQIIASGLQSVPPAPEGLSDAQRAERAKSLGELQDVFARINAVHHLMQKPLARTGSKFRPHMSVRAPSLARLSQQIPE
eukprot:m.41646 g.41646  ORF g.41646 m.41646 type:complete len:817 (-) comp12031_c0_seq1:1431-3881(-)